MSPAPAIAALAIAETLVWAALYYSFPALLPAFEAELGFSKTELAGAFTGALVLSALAAPLAGRLIDQGHGRWVLTGSALLGAAMLVALARVETQVQFYLVYTGLGLAMAGCLYEPCFSFLTHALGPVARRAITWVTLVAGFAGTVSFPGFHYLGAHYGWRGAADIFAAAVVLVAVPLFYFGTGLRGSPQAETGAADQRTGPGARRAVRAPAFWLLGLVFLAIAVNHGALISLILPLFAAQGFSTDAAVLAASMIGPMQVAGRLAMLSVERRVTAIGIGFGCLAAMFMASLLLLVTQGQVALAAGFVLLQGAGYGVTSILKPVITADVLGRQNFGVISGWLALPLMLGAAAAPTLGAALWGLGGTELLLSGALGAVVVAALALGLARRAAPGAPA